LVPFPNGLWLSHSIGGDSGVPNTGSGVLYAGTVFPWERAGLINPVFTAVAHNRPPLFTRTSADEKTAGRVQGTPTGVAGGLCDLPRESRCGERISRAVLRGLAVGAGGSKSRKTLALAGGMNEGPMRAVDEKSPTLWPSFVTRECPGNSRGEGSYGGRCSRRVHAAIGQLTSGSRGFTHKGRVDHGCVSEGMHGGMWHCRSAPRRRCTNARTCCGNIPL